VWNLNKLNFLHTIYKSIYRFSHCSYKDVSYSSPHVNSGTISYKNTILNVSNSVKVKYYKFILQFYHLDLERISVPI